MFYYLLCPRVFPLCCLVNYIYRYLIVNHLEKLHWWKVEVHTHSFRRLRASPNGDAGAMAQSSRKKTMYALRTYWLAKMFCSEVICNMDNYHNGYFKVMHWLRRTKQPAGSNLKLLIVSTHFGMCVGTLCFCMIIWSVLASEQYYAKQHYCH